MTWILKIVGDEEGKIGPWERRLSLIYISCTVLLVVHMEAITPVHHMLLIIIDSEGCASFFSKFWNPPIK